MLLPVAASLYEAGVDVFATSTTCASHRDAATERFNLQKFKPFHSLQHSILDVQLPVAARCQAIIVRHDKERLLPIACEI